MSLAVFLPHNVTYLIEEGSTQCECISILITSILSPDFSYRWSLLIACCADALNSQWAMRTFSRWKKLLGLIWILRQMPAWWERIHIRLRMWHITFLPPPNGKRRLLLEWFFWDVLGQSFFFMSKRRQDDQSNMVVALQDYLPKREQDLVLRKGQMYVLIDNICSDWWALRNSQGWGSHSGYHSLRGKFIRAQRN